MMNEMRFVSPEVMLGSRFCMLIVIVVIAKIWHRTDCGDGYRVCDQHNRNLRAAVRLLDGATAREARRIRTLRRGIERRVYCTRRIGILGVAGGLSDRV